MFIFTAGPHTALIKSSGARRTSSQIVIGGRMFAIPIIERVDTLDLRLRTITIHTPRGTTKTGVIVDVVAVCQVKIQSWGLSDDHDIDHGAVRLAAQHFIGKNNAQIDEAISSTIAGHQRAIIGGLTVEELYRDRDRFAKNMRDHCENDMRGMGLSIVSYVVMEISDDQGYITALGVSQTEKVKRVAMEGAAVMKNAAISAANESKTRADMAVNTQRERKIQSDMQIRMKTADANREVAKAIAIQRKAKAITVAEQDKELLVKTQIAKEKEAEAEREVIGVRVEEERLTKLINITIPADAELYKNRIEAEIVKESTRANAERIRAVAEAEAEAIRQRGIAETRILHDRVKVWMNNANPAAVMERLIDVLPEVAAEIAKPLENAKELVFIGDTSREDKDGQHISNLPGTNNGFDMNEIVEGMDMNRIVGSLLLGRGTDDPIDLKGPQLSVSEILQYTSA